MLVSCYFLKSPEFSNFMHVLARASLTSTRLPFLALLVEAVPISNKFEEDVVVVVNKP